MKVFVCEDSYEDIMTSIYDCWSYALKHGHNNVKLVRGPVVQQNLFDEYVYTEPDYEKIEKVTRSIKTKISERLFQYVVRATMSCEEDAPDAIYRYLILGFKYGAKTVDMLTEPAVMRIMELNRYVSNEAHFSREFARFASIDSEVYVCHLEPKNNIITFVGKHFEDRMPSENFIIIDDNRGTAIIHPKNEEIYLRTLTEEERERLRKTEEYKDIYNSMWKTFFQAISIKERESYERQRNMFPLRYRKHAVEFLD